MGVSGERLAIVEGIRTPFSKAGGYLSKLSADILGAFILKELMLRVSVGKDCVDEVIAGNVSQPSHAANIAKVIAIRAGFPDKVPAYTVHRNCASGAEALSSAYAKLLSGDSNIIAICAVESMSNIPFMYSHKMKHFFEKMNRARTLAKKLKLIASLRFSDFKPVVALLDGLTDPTTNLIMGKTAEILAKTFGISREDQDKFALRSHSNAILAEKNQRFLEEIVPISNYEDDDMLLSDDGPRYSSTMESLAKLAPYFDKINGTVTVGNSCQITDGAVSALVMLESKAKEIGLKPLGYVSSYAYAGLDPSQMGLGPVYATAKVLKKTGLSLDDIGLFEINEAFSAQVLAVLKAFSSKKFANEELNLTNSLGDISMETLNVNGGAIALGHPVGATGLRIIITLLRELAYRKQHRGLATMCIGGGQGGAFIVEVE